MAEELELTVNCDPEVLAERYELVSGRLREILAEEMPRGEYEAFFRQQAAFLIRLDEIRGQLESGAWNEKSEAELMADQQALYADILPKNYGTSFANPDYAYEQFGERPGRILSLLAAELRSGIPAVYQSRLEDWTILLELFVEIYSCCEGQDEPDWQEANQTIYWYFYDYSGLFAERMISGMTDPERVFARNIVTDADLTDLRYLYRYGYYVSDNERKVAEFLNAMSAEEVQAMADTYTEGYRLGFEAYRKDLSKKKSVLVIYPLGFERMMRAAVRNFEKIGLQVTIGQDGASVFDGLGAMRGAYSTVPNRQFNYDHKEDRAFFLDKAFSEHHLDMLRNAFERHKDQALAYGGPAVVEVFGEDPFSPASCAHAIRYSDKQQSVVVSHMSRAGQITNEYIPGEQRSFTIIAYPIPEIGGDFTKIFADTVRINTLDNVEYRRMQQCMIDRMDLADHVHIQGTNGNETDLDVAIWQLEDPEHQTAFENCVADVNIPVGEVFTSPVLEGTNGLLHVSEVFLNGLKFIDLKVWFKDGMISDYSCRNFDSEEEGRKYIQDNILMHHDTLPIGEFAIGTNTTAYKMGRQYGITDRLPILIAEKTGPHFAVGDTCYSHEEDSTIYNPNGKQIMPLDNAITAAYRKEDPSKAYFNCHTDITIPFAELGEITVIGRDGSSTDIIRDGRFVVPGTEALNIPLEELEQEQA